MSDGDSGIPDFADRLLDPGVGSVVDRSGSLIHQQNLRSFQ